MEWGYEVNKNCFVEFFVLLFIYKCFRFVWIKIWIYYFVIVLIVLDINEINVCV